MKIFKTKVRLLATIIIIAMSVLINVAVQLLISRFYGIAALGGFSVWRNNLQLTSGISKFGLVNLALSEFPKILHHKNQKQFWSLSRFLIVVLSCAVGLVAIMSYFLKLMPSSEAPFWLFVISFTGMAFISIASAVLRALDKVIISILLERLGIFTVFLALIFVSWLNDKEFNVEHWFFYSIFIASFTIGIWLYYSLIKIKSNPEQYFEKQDNIETNWLKNLKGFLFLEIGNILSTRITILIAAYFLSNQIIGQYAFMALLAGLTAIPLVAIQHLFAPKFSQMAAEKNILLLKKTVASCRLTCGLSTTILGLIILVTWPIAEHITGESNVVIPKLLILLIITRIITSTYNSNGTALAMAGFQNKNALIINTTLVLKAISLFVFIPPYGITALIIIELINAILVQAWTAIAYRRHIN